MVTLLRPHAEALLQRRDEVLGWQEQGEPSAALLADRNTHILSDVPLDLLAVLQAVQTEAQTRFG